ncbi:MAG TPA: altronate dehydratase family protein [Candidatus Blautia faecigallinarum]|uniref:Altronate dehydratase family protein n=1 Tax=Candidatus Blautia faecigallinarum TaxID=2838488 RepID=A0A9D2DT97_9FIRM|nr:altronate dehydratase family protein [Candidatus Blautia faecigallinarum]
MKSYLKIHPKDNVAVALCPLSAGTVIDLEGRTFSLAEDIPQGHKFAVSRIPAAGQIIKYGASVGTAGTDIPPGAWVHTHNMHTALGEQLTYTYAPQASGLPAGEERFFQGYRRTDGKAAVRNELWIIPTVGCVNSIASRLEQLAQPLAAGTIDAVAAFPHPYGCSQMGEDQENTRKILADLILHPNAGGVLVLGLGCENSSIQVLKNYLGPYDPNRVKFLVCQESEDEIAEGLRLLKELSSYAGTFRREPVSCSELTVGLKCGGSDGLSGITANPVVGVFSDLLISRGGATILTEVPEMFGAETQLMDRCINEDVFGQTVRLINDFKAYFRSHGQTVYENPSPGNKDGGISTLEDKSMGCVQKSGTAPVRAVLAYGQRIREKGLNLLNAPGNDLVSSTALAASGAHIILFTTGRGTPFASPVPTVKIASNSPLREKKPNWIDFDCGTLTDHGTITELGGQLFEYVLSVASGSPVKTELAGFHDMAIFKQGVTL